MTEPKADPVGWTADIGTIDSETDFFYVDLNFNEQNVAHIHWGDDGVAILWQTEEKVVVPWHWLKGIVEDFESWPRTRPPDTEDQEEPT